jgi:putative ABC transport system permease protein
MGLLRLALRNISGNGFRSLVIVFSVASIAGLLVTTMLFINGVNRSLDAGLQRLGADVLVVPKGGDTQTDTALLMGKPTNLWISGDTENIVREVPGVQAAASQIYLSSLKEAACCTVSETFLVVYDPETDFTVTPWLQTKLGHPLQKGEVIGGYYIFVPAGKEYITLYGSNVTLTGNLEATGTGLDQTIFMSLETAREIASHSLTAAAAPLNVPDDKISAILVKAQPGADINKLAFEIYKKAPGIDTVASPNLFNTYRQQTTGLLWGFFAFSILLLIVAVLLISLIFSMSANERRREIAVLRAIGATRNYILRSIMTEAAALAFTGAFLGIIAATALLNLFKEFISGYLKMPFLFPGLSSVLLYLGIGIIVTLVTVTLAVLPPALRTNRQEAAAAMRE